MQVIFSLSFSPQQQQQCLFFKHFLYHADEAAVAAAEKTCGQ
jgi:hypothetical protein